MGIHRDESGELLISSLLEYIDENDDEHSHSQLQAQVQVQDNDEDNDNDEDQNSENSKRGNQNSSNRHAVSDRTGLVADHERSSGEPKAQALQAYYVSTGLAVRTNAVRDTTQLQVGPVPGCLPGLIP